MSFHSAMVSSFFTMISSFSYLLIGGDLISSTLMFRSFARPMEFSGIPLPVSFPLYLYRTGNFIFLMFFFRFLLPFSLVTTSLTNPLPTPCSPCPRPIPRTVKLYFLANFSGNERSFLLCPAACADFESREIEFPGRTTRRKSLFYLFLSTSRRERVFN